MTGTPEYMIDHNQHIIVHGRIPGPYNHSIMARSMPPTNYIFCGSNVRGHPEIPSITLHIDLRSIKNITECKVQCQLTYPVEEEDNEGNFSNNTINVIGTTELFGDRITLCLDSLDNLEFWMTLRIPIV